MTSTLVIAVVVIAAVIWLAVLAVSALRSRGPEEIPANLSPPESDEILETSRLERAQQAAVLLSAVLAVGIPLYYLGESNRQEQFVEDFHEESVERGLHHYEEFACGSCHGADGGGGAASYVEKRSGVNVTWAAPSINDVFYRYGRDEVRYWLVYGRQNSPMPAWGTDGGGPMNDQQIEELLDYLESDEFQISQEQVAAEVDPAITAELSALDGADGAMDSAVLEQRQLISEIDRSQELEPVFADLDARSRELRDSLGDGIDTDGDGVADSQEIAVNQILAEAKQALLLPGVEEITFSNDPENPDTVEGTSDPDLAQQIADTYRELADTDRAPILESFADAIEDILANQEGEDTDGDGLTDGAETQIGAQTTLAVGAITNDFAVTNLDPANPESVPGTPDLETAETGLASIETRYVNIRLNDTNRDALLESAEASLESLEQARTDAKWEFDLEAIADHSFGGDLDRADRVVGIFQAYCARCHTSGYSAGLPFVQEAGSGGFGPAVWEGRPAVQFLTDEDLKDFLIVGAVANQPYGVNGMGSGRMPGFGEILAEDDLLDLATWLRDGDLTGKGGAS